jgi:protein-L-isoaspartate(D-aspartate) O-methyltransferase
MQLRHMDSIITLYIAKNNEALVQNLFQASIITKERVVQAMKSMDRNDFCPRYPYDDSPQSIGYGATISAPFVKLRKFK